MFYSAMKNLSDRFDEVYRSCPVDVSDREHYEKWRQKAVEKLNDILKLSAFEKSELMPEILEECVIENNIVRQKVLLRTEADIYMPVYILIPENCRNNPKAHCMIAMSGHQGGGMASVAGIRDNELLVSAIEKFNYDYGLQLARQGIVAVCPETRGFGERREAAIQKPEALLMCSCYNLSRLAASLNMTLMGMQVYDVIRLVDYLFERNEWNMDKLGILGFSGGGLQALYTAALDERIKNIIISGYMYGYKQALFEKNGNCSCNYVNGLWQNYDMGDIGAMLAPRKLIIQSGRKDHLNGKDGINNVLSQVNIIKSAYHILEKDENVRHYIYEGVHRWYSDDLVDYLYFLND